MALIGAPSSDLRALILKCLGLKEYPPHPSIIATRQLPDLIRLPGGLSKK